MSRKLYLPESARRAMSDEVARDRQEIQSEYSDLRDELAFWTRELRTRLNEPHLKVVKAHEQVAYGSPMKAGYYHVLLEHPGHPTTILPIEYPDGSFRDLGSHVYDLMEKEDMWNDRARKAGRERGRLFKEAAERQRERESQARVEEYNERWKSANSSQILVSKSIT
jgi:hypothetical protein